MPAFILPGRAAKGLRPSGPWQVNRESPALSGLVLWYPLTPFQSWTDAIQRVQATPAGGPLLAGDALIGTGVGFDGTDDSLPAPYSAAYNVATLTVSFWMRSVSNNQGVMVGRYDNTGPGSSWMIWRNSGTLLLYVVGGSQDTGWATTDGTMHHVVATYESSVDLRLYVDGTLFFTSGTIGAIQTPANTPITIGTATALGFAAIQCLADVRVYNRKLTTAEIWRLYDPQTRWDLYWQPGRTLYFDAGAAPPTGRTSRLAVMGVS